MSLNALPPARQEAINEALKSGNTSALTADELLIFNSIPKGGSIQDLQKLAGAPGVKGDTIKFTVQNPDGSTTAKTIVQSSDAFLESDAAVRRKAAELAKSCKNDNSKDGNYKHCQGMVDIVAGAVTPEVSDTVAISEDFLNQYFPSDEKNRASNAQGKDVLKGMLAKSPDPQIADLAKKSLSGDVEATRELETIIASWQPSMVANAKVAKEKLDAVASEARLLGKNPEVAMEQARAGLRKDGVITKYGDPAFTDKTWIVPAKYLSAEYKPTVIPPTSTTEPSGSTTPSGTTQPSDGNKPVVYPDPPGDKGKLEAEKPKPGPLEHLLIKMPSYLNNSNDGFIGENLTPEQKAFLDETTKARKNDGTPIDPKDNLSRIENLKKDKTGKVPVDLNGDGIPEQYFDIDRLIKDKTSVYMFKAKIDMSKYFIPVDSE